MTKPYAPVDLIVSPLGWQESITATSRIFQGSATTGSLKVTDIPEVFRSFKMSQRVNFGTSPPRQGAANAFRTSLPHHNKLVILLLSVPFQPQKTVQPIRKTAIMRREVGGNASKLLKWLHVYYTWGILGLRLVDSCVSNLCTTT